MSIQISPLGKQKNGIRLLQVPSAIIKKKIG